MGSGLPNKDTLLAACRGFPPIEDDPILDSAAELVSELDAQQAARLREYQRLAQRGEGK
ncbi:hypothetical protein [Nocardia lijiangensis]|uniref:hypothetical protein n=1 Tax=Nocardia lijiangensis TaxID=299618 RepID=UPI003D75B95F